MATAQGAGVLGRNRRRSALVVICMFLALAGAPLAATAQGTATTGENFPGVHGHQYTSPIYGYSLTWDTGWIPLLGWSKQGEDYLKLYNGISGIVFKGATTQGATAQACVTQEQSRQATEGVNFEASTSTDGKPIAGQQGSNDAWAVFDYASGGVRYSVYIECYGLAQPHATLLITQTVQSDKYNSQIAARSTLLKSLTFPAGTTRAVTPAASGKPTSSGGIVVPLRPPGGPTATASSTRPTGTTPSPTPLPPGTHPTSGGEPGVSGQHYTSPTYGYALRWDASWQVHKAESSGGDDYLELDNGTSSISFAGATNQGSTAQACLANAKAGYAGATGVSNFQATTDQNNTPIADNQGNDAWAVYDFDYKGSSGNATHLAIYLECYGLSQPNATLLISQSVTASDYNNQINARSTLLKTLTLPSGPGGGQTPEATVTGGLAAPLATEAG